MKTNKIQSLISFDELSDDAIVPENKLAEVHPISKSSRWRQVKAGTFPPPIKLGPQLRGWRVGTIREYLKKLAESNDKEIK